MRIFKQVPRILFGQGALSRLEELLPAKSGADDYRVFVIDAVHRGKPVGDRVPVEDGDLVEWFDAVKEPSTAQVDAVRDRIVQEHPGKLPTAVIGIGGGAAMDVAKATSVMLTNAGSSAEYQGWDLVKNPAVFKVGVPTLSGSGAEASRTAVLMGKEKKFGINSDFSMFDAILLDSTLIEGVPTDQWFHSGMDCYIHCVESITGTMINELAMGYAAQALDLCEKVYLGEGTPDQLMTASYMGGCSIVNSEVGVCHALSYGLSMELGYRHGLANCVAFNVLDEFYGEHVEHFRKMVDRHNVTLPTGGPKTLDDAAMERMIKMTLMMERPLTNALGENWRDVMTAERIVDLYMKM